MIFFGCLFSQILISFRVSRETFAYVRRRQLERLVFEVKFSFEIIVLVSDFLGFDFLFADFHFVFESLRPHEAVGFTTIAFKHMNIILYIGLFTILAVLSHLKARILGVLRLRI